MGRRRPGPKEIRAVFRESEEELWAQFRKSALIKHSGEKGTFREEGVAKFLRAQLPARYGVVKGELVDVGGRRSGQIDIIIFDATRAAPFVRGAKYSLWILPAEAALATVEVKSLLNKSHVESAIKGIRSLQALRPWSKPFTVVSDYREELSAPEGPRVQTSVFAFKSDLVVEEWAKKETNRARVALTTANLHSSHLDRILVLDRGMLNVAKGNVLMVGEQGVLLEWYLTLLNFLEREVHRRKAIPFASYLPRGESPWQRVLPDDFPGAIERRQVRQRVDRASRALKGALGQATRRR